jgi:hypothetical protein
MNGPVVANGAPGRDHTGNQHRSLGVIVAEIRDELKSFLYTRVEMIRSELDESLAAARLGVPLIVLALLLGAVGFLLLSIAVAVLSLCRQPLRLVLGFSERRFFVDIVCRGCGLFRLQCIAQKIS